MSLTFTDNNVIKVIPKEDYNKIVFDIVKGSADVNFVEIEAINEKDDSFEIVMKKYDLVNYDIIDMDKYIKCLNEGVYELHSNNIIHRDIKPENIVQEIKPNGEINYRIIDFDISEIVETKSLLNNYDDFVPTFSYKGTKGYIAPEIIYENKAYVSSDYYAVGKTILYAFWKRAQANKIVKTNPDVQFEAFFEQKNWTTMLSEVGVPKDYEALIIGLTKPQYNTRMNYDNVKNYFGKINDNELYTISKVVSDSFFEGGSKFDDNKTLKNKLDELFKKNLTQFFETVMQRDYLRDGEVMSYLDSNFKINYLVTFYEKEFENKGNSELFKSMNTLRKGFKKGDFLKENFYHLSDFDYLREKTKNYLSKNGSPYFEELTPYFRLLLAAHAQNVWGITTDYLLYVLALINVRVKDIEDYSPFLKELIDELDVEVDNYYDFKKVMKDIKKLNDEIYDNISYDLLANNFLYAYMYVVWKMPIAFNILER